jgi:tetratricopeptide (TPR) repeat protein
VQTQAAIDRGDVTGEDADARYLLGIAHARQGNFVEAAAVLEEFVNRHPQHENAAWVRCCLDQAAGCRALLVGVSQYASHEILTLPGVAQDLPRIQKALVERLGFPQVNITVLGDIEATYQAFVSALKRLAEQDGALDHRVLIYFAGRADNESLIFHDTTWNENQPGENALAVAELHQLVRSIPAGSRTLILDTNPIPSLIDLVRADGGYSLLLGASPGQEAHEQEEGGVFTSLLAEELERDPGSADGQDLSQRLTDRMASAGWAQTPLLVGDERFLLAPAWSLLRAHHLSQPQAAVPESAEDLARHLDAACRFPIPVPEIFHQLGLGLLDRRRFADAATALEKGLAISPRPDPEMTLEVAVARMRSRRYEEGLAGLRDYRASVSGSEIADEVDEFVSRMAGRKPDRRRALLVGIREYTAEAVPQAAGAVNDVVALRDVLVQECGFQAADVLVLRDAEATREAILAAFDQLVEAARGEMGLFYFAGVGSVDEADQPTILSADGRQEGIFDIALYDLAARVGNRPTNLLTIVDAGWAESPAPGSRFCEREDRSLPVARALIPHFPPPREREGKSLPPRIGRLLLCQGNIRSSRDAIPSIGVEAEEDGPVAEGGQPRWHGRLTRALLESLRSSDPATITEGQLIDAFTSRAREPYVVGDQPDELIFRNAVAEEFAADLLLRAGRDAVLTPLVALLRRLIEQRNGAAEEAQLNLGLALATRGDHEDAIVALQRAVDQTNGTSAEARYQLGRLLFESKSDLARAISELRRARDLDPGNPRAAFYLAHAIRKLIESDLLVEATSALTAYLDGGAPLGCREEVRQFLASRRSPESR